MRVTGLMIAAVSVSLMGLAPQQAHATRCVYPERAVKGPVRPNFAAAQNSAIGAWQQVANRQLGRRYSNWYYSGDRSVTCKWNERGNKVQCSASAVPCGE
jgi:hypothetical protein